MARLRPRRVQLDSRASLRRHAHRHREPQPHCRTRRRRHGLWGVGSRTHGEHGHSEASLGHMRRRPARGVVRAFDALRPCCAEAVRRCAPSQVPSSGRRDSHSNRRTWTWGEGVHRLRRTGPRCLRGISHPAAAAVPSWATIGRAALDPSSHARAQGSCPQVSVVGNLGESRTSRPLWRRRSDKKASYKTHPATSVKVFTILHPDPERVHSHQNPRVSRRSSHFRRSSRPRSLRFSLCS